MILDGFSFLKLISKNVMHHMVCPACRLPRATLASTHHFGSQRLQPRCSGNYIGGINSKTGRNLRTFLWSRQRGEIGAKKTVKRHGSQLVLSQAADDTDMAPSSTDGATGQGILVYGCTGFTGQLVAAEAARRGLDVTLAGPQLIPNRNPKMKQK